MCFSVRAAILIISLCALPGCAKQKAAETAKKQSPAKIDVHPDESEVYRITVTPQAAERLGITTARVDRRDVPRHRTFGGEVVVPSGNRIVVSAPLPGTLGSPDGTDIPTPGTRIEAGRPIFSLVPQLSPERDVPTPAERVQMANARASLISSQIVAEGDMKQAQAETEGARIAFQRAEQLFQGKAGSARAVDEAQASLNLAEKKLEAAHTRMIVLSDLTLDAEKGELRTLQITAPDSGILNGLSAARGQTVTAGAPLFEILDLANVWIRVPVYVGQLSKIEMQADAAVGDLQGETRSQERMATRIAAPPSADPLSSTVDLYYRLSNQDGSLHPGQRVGVTLPLKDCEESLVVPKAAILYDIHGTAWVYERCGDHVFQRHRVLVRHTTDELAVLASGPEANTEVVVDGAAELFGTEFGTGK